MEESGMMSNKREDKQFNFLKTQIGDGTDVDIDDKEWKKREEQIDMAWYDADEEGNAFYDPDRAGGGSLQQNDLFASYASQEVQEQEQRLK